MTLILSFGFKYINLLNFQLGKYATVEVFSIVGGSYYFLKKSNKAQQAQTKLNWCSFETPKQENLILLIYVSTSLLTVSHSLKQHLASSRMDKARIVTFTSAKCSMYFLC